jgi:hypothetical protein
MTLPADIAKSYEKYVRPEGLNKLPEPWKKGKRVGRRGAFLCEPCRKAKKGYAVSSKGLTIC